MPITGLIRYESVTVGAGAVGMTVTAAQNCIPQVAEIAVEDAAIRYRADGSDPSASEGIGVEVGGVITLLNQGEVNQFRAIRRDGTNATLRVQQGMDYIS